MLPSISESGMLYRVELEGDAERDMANRKEKRRNFMENEVKREDRKIMNVGSF